MGNTIFDPEIYFVILAITLIVFIVIYVLRNHVSFLKNVPFVKVDEVKDDIKTGDLVQFRADDMNVPNTCQTFINATPFTHVGIIYRKGDYIYLLESHPTHYGGGRHTSGYKLYSLQDRVNNYKGKLYIRHLKEPITTQNQKTFDEFIKKYKDHPYFPSNMEIAHSYINGCMLGNETKNPIKLHCAGLVSYIQKHILKRGKINNIDCAKPISSKMDDYETFVFELK